MFFLSQIIFCIFFVITNYILYKIINTCLKYRDFSQILHFTTGVLVLVGLFFQDYLFGIDIFQQISPSQSSARSYDFIPFWLQYIFKTIFSCYSYIINTFVCFYHECTWAIPIVFCGQIIHNTALPLWKILWGATALGITISMLSFVIFKKYDGFGSYIAAFHFINNDPVWCMLLALIGLIVFLFLCHDTTIPENEIFTKTTVAEIPMVKHNPIFDNNEAPVIKNQKATPEQKLYFSPKTDNEYQLPSKQLIQWGDSGNVSKNVTVQDHREKLNQVLKDFGIQGVITNMVKGPVVSLYELELSRGIKAARVINLTNDIARFMETESCRIAPIPGKNLIGIEIPNLERKIVYFQDIIESELFKKRASCNSLCLALGYNIQGDPVIVDLAKMPHLLVGGSTGSGKSVAINTMIMSLLYTLSPKHCRFLMVDPKMLELSVYDEIPHMLAPVITNPHKAVAILKWAIQEMTRRYSMISAAQLRNIYSYNEQLAHAEPVKDCPYNKDTPMPFLVIIIDEMADLMLIAGKEIEGFIQRLAQMGRAAGIHLIIATQRPSVAVVTGLIKANMPARVSFRVTSKMESNIILGSPGAENLLGQGDMLYSAAGDKLVRLHGPYVTDQALKNLIMFWKQQGAPVYAPELLHLATSSEPEKKAGNNKASAASFEESGPDYEDDVNLDDGNDDVLLQQAIALIRKEKRVSTSFLQRYFQIGYNRAARLMEALEKEGIVSEADHKTGKRVIMGYVR